MLDKREGGARGLVFNSPHIQQSSLVVTFMLSSNHTVVTKLGRRKRRVVQFLPLLEGGECAGLAWTGGVCCTFHWARRMTVLDQSRFQAGVKAEEENFINLRVVAQDNQELHFKIKRSTPMRRLIGTYCKKKVGHTSHPYHALSLSLVLSLVKLLISSYTPCPIHLVLNPHPSPNRTRRTVHVWERKMLAAGEIDVMMV